MNLPVVPKGFPLSTGITESVSLASRIIQSNNARDVAICAIREAAKVEYNRINHKAKHDKFQIDSCCNQIKVAINSQKLTSAQKKEFILTLMNKIDRV